MNDQILYCRDCSREFVFTVGEQEFYASRGLTNVPSRCPECRAARKQNGPRSMSGGNERDSRAMYTTICAGCGKEAQVPFQPREDRPVYCRDCYQPRATR